MYIYIYICIYTCMSACIYIYIYIHIERYLNIVYHIISWVGESVLSALAERSVISPFDSAGILFSRGETCKRRVNSPGSSTPSIPA